ncbi:dihydrodipicolinate synthase family protein [Finegoldia sp. P1-F-LS]|uniref:Dihydrodipicolinate synthetase family n=1 Tax=Finegoldia magna BVS033A4 TaxID=866773 RepID=E1KYB5_FINMA|nr:dihydrodipicolinate synthase family protein [Finegoldia magna]EFL53979.1 dihydrodipicolinate synthetase family [Finegoldia magna BVS033A4]
MKYEIITPLLTSINDDGSVDIDGTLNLVEYVIDGGVDGILPLGSAGEFTAFTFEQKRDLLKAIIKKVGKRIKVLAGTTSLVPQETVELSNEVIKCGADGVVILPQFYFGLSDDEAFEYFSYMAENIDGDIYIYNYPARTGYNISIDVVLKLIEKYPNIVGLKDTIAETGHTQELISKSRLVRDDFRVYSGFDNQFTANIAAGGSGCISGFSNIRPRLWADWVKAANDNNLDEIHKYQKIINKMMDIYAIQTNFSNVCKNVLKREGMKINTKCMLPYDNISEDQIDRAFKILEDSEKING